MARSLLETLVRESEGIGEFQEFLKYTNRRSKKKQREKETTAIKQERLFIVLYLVPQTGRVGEVEGVFGLGVGVVVRARGSVDLLAAPKRRCHGQGPLGSEDAGRVVEFDLQF